MESDPTRMCALLVGLPDVIVNGVGDGPKWLRIEITSRAERPPCGCGKPAHRHGNREVRLVDLPCFGRPTRAGPADRLEPLCDDDQGGVVGDAVGEVAGRPPRASGVGSR